MSLALGLGLSLAHRRGFPASLDLDFQKQRYSMSLLSKAFGDIITFTRASAATRVNAQGLIETVAANVPRIDYDPVTLECKGLLIEEQRTNLAAASSDFTGATNGWSGVNWLYLTRQPDQMSALGLSFSSVAINQTGQSAWFASDTISAAIGEKYVASILAKAKSVSNHYAISIRGNYPRRVDAVFNLITGEVVYSGATTWTGVQAKSKNCGNGIWLLEVSGTNQVADNINMFHGPCNSNGGGSWEGGRTSLCDAYITAAQFEKGEFRTSYIPTNGSQVTRAADVCSINTLSPWFNAANGTFFAEFDSLSPTTENRRVVACNAACAPISMSSGSGFVNFFDGGVLQTNGYSVSANNSAKAVAAYTATEKAVGVNGGSLTKGVVNGAFPVSGATIVYLGSQTGDMNFINGNIRKFRYYPKRLSDAQLQALTA